MLENKEKRTFKFEQAITAGPRPSLVKTESRKGRRTRPDQTREIVVKLIEAIRKM